MFAAQTPIETMTVDELKQFTMEHKEQEYLLVDVREPEEYEVEHIPVAKLVPVMDLELGRAELDAADHAIFYCRSGNRSMRGATVAAAQDLGIKKIYNLTGGIGAFQGRKLSDAPNLKAFTGDETLSQLLLRAMDLEKAADKLYGALAEHLAGTPVEALVRKLEEGEEGHARAIYGMLKRVSPQPLLPFEQIYAQLDGRVLESGEPLVKLVAWLTSAQADRAAILELALDLELKAYDMYRNLAAKTDDPELEKAFYDLAQHEQRHASTVARGIGEMARVNV
jgi:rubrerythrin/rhodanese-related sulfurtransferase